MTLPAPATGLPDFTGPAATEEPGYADPVDVARFDVTYTPYGRIGRRLTGYPTLWAYARDLYQQPAFGDSTDFTTFARLGAAVPDWDAPHDRGPLDRSSPRRGPGA